MIAAPLREPRPASPEPYAPERADEQARRPASRPQTLSGRQSRLNLDSLAIGAPLTAALVGVLVTEGDAAFGNGVADAAGDGSATHRAQDEESPALRDGGQTRLADPGAQGVARAAGASTSGEILDPVAAEAAAALAASSGTAATGTLAPPNGAAAGSEGDTIVWATPVSRSAPAHRSKTWGARRQRRR
jgi:hypothetical protein